MLNYCFSIVTDNSWGNASQRQNRKVAKLRHFLSFPFFLFLSAVWWSPKTMGLWSAWKLSTTHLLILSYGIVHVGLPKSLWITITWGACKINRTETMKHFIFCLPTGVAWAITTTKHLLNIVLVPSKKGISGNLPLRFSEDLKIQSCRNTQPIWLFVKTF